MFSFQPIKLRLALRQEKREARNPVSVSEGGLSAPSLLPTGLGPELLSVAASWYEKLFKSNAINSG